ncbi:FkbM family methyltransferase [Comamonas sp. J-3]|uniref:FkbM family methyltransferase n=1 Tax=Comamonas trifloxystrobinivorans TaxID=3350256 RepID=UPI003729E138
MKKNIAIKIEQLIEFPEQKKENGASILEGTNYYAIGKNTETLKIQKILNIIAIIDDTCTPRTYWNEIPLIKSVDADKKICVINCSTSIRPIDTYHYLKNMGFESIISIAELSKKIGDDCLLPDFIKEQKHEINQHADLWQEIFDQLSDQVSKDMFLDVLKFRLSADPEHMRNFKVRLKDQYFENFMQYKNEVFVDAGGFDGDTAMEFAQRYPDYNKIMFFEPSEKNLRKAKINLSSVRDIHFFQIGLSNSKATLRFNSEIGSASAINEHGNEEIAVNTLDSMIDEPVTFIKMDLEGWEIPAIEGAREHIKNTAPKLALATYHRASDLREIYLLIQSLGNDYEIFFRHYTQGWSESILFFKPRL